MNFRHFLRAGLLACALLAQSAYADEPGAEAPQAGYGVAGDDGGIQQILERAQELVGIRYRRFGDRPQTGFDCSGFVDYVFREGAGLILPHASREISRTGTPVAKGELEPGDLVFFRTLRHAFSHVGIYLGDHLFVHAPRSGERVRIDSLQRHYWAKRYNGARRLLGGVASAEGDAQR